jgi:hypothetical protein
VLIQTTISYQRTHISFVENKKLLDIEDIFHTSLEELETILAGKWDLTITQEHVTKNRTKLLKDRKLSPPCAFLGEEPLFKIVDTESVRSTSMTFVLTI